MAADPSTIPASADVTNITVEPLKVAGLMAFAVGETRTVNLAAFQLAQRSIVWNALYNALLKNLIQAPAVTFDVNELATGHQSVVNRGGHGVGGATVPVPGGLNLPLEVEFTNLLGEPLYIAGVYLYQATDPLLDPHPGILRITLYAEGPTVYGASPSLFSQPGDTAIIGLASLPINQQAAVWNALIVARDAGYISSPQLTVAVQAGFTGHQGTENYGGHGPGGQIDFLLQTPYVGITVGGVPLTVRGQDITVQGL